MPDVSLLALLLLALALLTAAALVAARMDFLQPAVIGAGVMTISALFAAIGARWWASPLSFAGWWLIFLAMAVFVAAGLWTYAMARPRTPEAPVRPQAVCEVAWLPMIAFCALMAYMANCNLHAMYDVSLALGNTEGYRGMISTVRTAIEMDQGALFNRWMNYRTILAQMLATIYLYIFFRNTILCGWRWRFLAALPPVLCYLPFLVLSTGRMTMLTFVIYGFLIAAILYLRKHGYAMAARRRALLAALAAGAVFVVLFFLMGLLTGKTGGSGGRSFFQIIAHYAGLSLPAFGEIITHPMLEDGLIGSHTLGPLYRILTSIGIAMPPVMNFMPFTAFSGIDTNVYTALWRYTWDFGIIGMLLMMFLLGAGYTLAYCAIRHGRPRPYALMAYATFAYPVFWFPMDDRLLMDIFNSTTFYDLAVLFLLYELLIVHARKTPIKQK